MTDDVRRRRDEEDGHGQQHGGVIHARLVTLFCGEIYFINIL